MKKKHQVLVNVIILIALGWIPSASSQQNIQPSSTNNSSSAVGYYVSNETPANTVIAKNIAAVDNYKSLTILGLYEVSTNYFIVYYQCKDNRNETNTGTIHLRKLSTGLWVFDYEEGCIILVN